MLRRPSRDEELAVARVARRHHAVEHVDAGADPGAQILGRADAHEVARRFCGISGAIAPTTACMTAGGSPTPRPPSARPSNGSAAISARCARRSATSVPPCTMPKRSWPGGARRHGAAARPARGARHRRGHDLARRVRRRALVERHRDVAAEQRLDLHRALGREPLLGAVEVRAKGHAVLVDRAPLAQAEDLEAARVGEDRARPGHEAVQAAELVRRARRRGAATGDRCCRG